MAESNGALEELRAVRLANGRALAERFASGDFDGWTAGVVQDGAGKSSLTMRHERAGIGVTIERAVRTGGRYAYGLEADVEVPPHPVTTPGLEKARRLIAHVTSEDGETSLDRAYDRVDGFLAEAREKGVDTLAAEVLARARRAADALGLS